MSDHNVTPDPAAALNLEDQLRQSQKMEAIGRLAGGIAHDLNNALTAIAGYAELALGEVASDACGARRHRGDPARRRARRIGDAAAARLQPQATARAAAVRSERDDRLAFADAVAAAGPDVEVQIAPADRCRVLGDPGQVEQAVINLALNARDAMPGGGTPGARHRSRRHRGRIRRAASAPMTPGRYVVLRVSDTGHGMPREAQARIFEPFFTTKDVGKGTGLGLSMVYGTLKQMRGFIFVDSEESRHYVPSLFSGRRRPRNGPRPGRRQHRRAARPRDAAGRRGRAGGAQPGRVGAAPRRLSSAARGFRRGSAALADAHDGPLDLLLTDAMMPGTSGVELAHTDDRAAAGSPVIVMSGYTEETLELPAARTIRSRCCEAVHPARAAARIRECLENDGVAGFTRATSGASADTPSRSAPQRIEVRLKADICARPDADVVITSAAAAAATRCRRAAASAPCSSPSPAVV